MHSRAQIGVEAPAVSVEIHLTNGLPSLTIVGLPETAVRESKDRVRSALLNSALEFPRKRITLNLAPADLPKKVVVLIWPSLRPAGRQRTTTWRLPRRLSNA